MKVKYIGESFYNGFGLTNNKIYECISVDLKEKCIEIVDDEGDAYIYPIKNPRPLDDSSKGGKWVIIEDTNNMLYNVFKELNIL